MKTYSPKLAEVQRQWHVVDAEGQPLGRLATHVATILKGKHKVIYATHLDTGDYVIVVNAAKVKVTGRKPLQKMYYRHSMYPGGLKSINFTHMQEAFPERIIEHAVKGMLPHGPLGSEMLRKLKVYAGPTHPHQAQLAGQLPQEAKAQEKAPEKKAPRKKAPEKAPQEAAQAPATRAKATTRRTKA